MADTFNGFSLASAQLEGMKGRRNQIGKAWAEQLAPLLKAKAEQITDIRAVWHHFHNWEWAYFDANRKLLLGKVSGCMATDCYLSELTPQELTLFQQGRYEIATEAQLGDGTIPEYFLRQMLGR